MKTFHIEATINAPIDTCWNAWTDVETAQQWLGATSIGINAGDDYCVSTSIPYLSGRHKILEITPNQCIKLQTYIDGWPADALVQFQELDDKTKITLDYSVDTTHAPKSIEPLVTEGYAFYFIRGSWNHVFFQLRSLLEDKHPGVIISPQNNDHEINLTIDIKSSPEIIYNSLIDKKLTQQWIGSDFFTDAGEIDPKVGGRYCYGWYPKGTPEEDLHDGPSKILELEPNKLLVHNWHGAQKIAHITWQLEDLGNGITRLAFSHSPILGLSSGNIWSYRSGWSEGLYGLKWYAEREELSQCWFSSK